MRAVERSLDVTPDYMFALNARARFYTFAGRLAGARDLFERVIPVLSQNRIIHRVLVHKSTCQFASNDMADAPDTARKSLDCAPNAPHSLAIAAASASVQGEANLASRFMETLLDTKPHPTLPKIRPLGFADQHIEEVYRSALTAAGLPLD
ncbi:hypothetical protein [Hoeflea prorocentri]|uniref:Tetratricopeptide repeat protein n=1 Tax=Hoeflea prorocentri TaxID=1922333 RepID=A0A9X3ZIF2_9HYPH|nr:hypothetical protein [Hoeflea prorocentri]MCY6382857.1 hypothetical protein [Hoeflea prorocentri]MDA5400657.1 hypothetical protein [Hoeflea prorocentri]